MSMQFGRWNFDGGPTRLDYLEKISRVLAPYGPDGNTSYIDGGVSIIYRPFHTTKESRLESQPYVGKSGTVIVWDGRLDNRAELLKEVEAAPDDASDLLIVASAYEKWGATCLPKLIGDWTLAAWSPQEASLLLAKDPIGTRHLYYSVEDDGIAWSSVMDPLVLLAGHTLSLNEEYIAGWLSYFPASHLTPFVGIDAVPPACFVRITNKSSTRTKYWDFNFDKRIRYRSDREYEEHFRSVFTSAVRRKLRSDRPVLAELSGGMDSSSIVCIADSIITGGAAETPALDTVSYYDDSEPNWNERPYFTKVEEKRGREGCHIDVSGREFSQADPDGHRYFSKTGAGGKVLSEARKQLLRCMASRGNRVVLSGMGGDEVMGGVPTPIPELEDLIACFRFTSFAGRLKAWALAKRKPWFHLLLETLGPFLPPGWVGTSKHRRPPPWLDRAFVKRNRVALDGYHRRIRFFGALPSFQENVATLEGLRRQLASCGLSSAPLCEYRYPFLDRDLLEFIYAIPREQVVRPGQRRSLMRRALVGIVPEELLNRKRKAFVSRWPLASISEEWPQLMKLSEQMTSAALGIVKPQSFVEVLQQGKCGGEVATVKLLRTLEVEHWLKAWQQWQDRDNVPPNNHGGA
jgi:asparagine synthase (glutamine-hydrolysing)